MYSLRKATQNDAPHLRNIVQTVGINPFGIYWKRFFVLESKDTIIGCVQLKNQNRKYQELTSLAILPSWQGQKLSTLLIQKCIEVSTKELFLVCDAQLELMYKKHGFYTLPKSKQSNFYRRHLFISRVFWFFMSNATTPILMRLERI